MNKLSFGVFLPFYAVQTSKIDQKNIFDVYRQIVIESERLGFDSIWLDDHLMYKDMSILECWTNLSALASTTKKIRIGTMITPVNFRNPALLAKMAATVDNISKGRLEFGIGAGAQKEEHQAYGLSFPDLKARTQRMKEAVEIIKLLWTTKKSDYSGKHYTVKNAICEPKPIQKPHPKITIGGCGEKFTLRVTAQHADRADFGYLDLKEYAYKIEILKRHCESVGRDFKGIEKSCWLAGQIFLAKNQSEINEIISKYKPMNVSEEEFLKQNLIGTSEQICQRIGSFSRLGANHFMLFFGDLPEIKSLQLFSKDLLKKCREPIS